MITIRSYPPLVLLQDPISTTVALLPFVCFTYCLEAALSLLKSSLLSTLYSLLSTLYSLLTSTPFIFLLTGTV